MIQGAITCIQAEGMSRQAGALAAQV